MRYLLDVNALVALGFLEHEFHSRVAKWVSSESPSLATCSITELGFVRVLSQVPQYRLGVVDALTLLLRLKSSRKADISFIADDIDLSQLPRWVRSPHQLTDGHLLCLAKASGGAFATLDRSIPGAFLIPAH